MIVPAYVYFVEVIHLTYQKGHDIICHIRRKLLSYQNLFYKTAKEINQAPSLKNKLSDK